MKEFSALAHTPAIRLIDVVFYVSVVLLRINSIVTERDCFIFDLHGRKKSHIAFTLSK